MAPKMEITTYDAVESEKPILYRIPKEKLKEPWSRILECEWSPNLVLCKDYKHRIYIMTNPLLKRNLSSFILVCDIDPRLWRGSYLEPISKYELATLNINFDSSISGSNNSLLTTDSVKESFFSVLLNNTTPKLEIFRQISKRVGTIVNHVPQLKIRNIYIVVYDSHLENNNNTILQNCYVLNPYFNNTKLLGHLNICLIENLNSLYKRIDNIPNFNIDLIEIHISYMPNTKGFLQEIYLNKYNKEFKPLIPYYMRQQFGQNVNILMPNNNIYEKIETHTDTPCLICKSNTDTPETGPRIETNCHHTLHIHCNEKWLINNNNTPYACSFCGLLLFPHNDDF